MRQSSSHTLFMAVAVVVCMTLFPNAVSAASPCTARVTPSTPAARAELWRGALERFSAERPDLTAEQQQFVRQAVSMGEDMATLQQDARAQAAFARRATQLVARARELFSNNELGALFTSMGQTQVWLARMVAMPAYCDCPPNPCPGGSCVMGCVSWESDDGTRHVGLCVMPPPPEPE
jgi:hypothetical protein